MSSSKNLSPKTGNSSLADHYGKLELLTDDHVNSHEELVKALASFDKAPIEAQQEQYPLALAKIIESIVNISPIFKVFLVQLSHIADRFPDDVATEVLELLRTVDLDLHDLFRVAQIKLIELAKK